MSRLAKQMLGEVEGDPPGTIRMDAPDRNPLSDLADQVEGAAHRIAGLIPRRHNTDISGVDARLIKQRLSAARDLLNDVAELVDR